MTSWFRRLIWRARRKRREAELQEELAFHLESEAEERLEDGLGEREAHHAARRELGNIALISENTRAVWGWTAFEHLAQDVRYGLRGLRRNPGFTSAAVLSLALGIGANTAIFSMIDALMLRRLPVRDPQQLIQLQFRDAGRGAGETFSYAIVRELSKHNDIFAGVCGFSTFSGNVGTAQSLTRVPGALVTGSCYQTLGLQPAAGRLISEEDDQTGAPPVAVLSYGYWERQFARVTSVIGSTIPVNGVNVAIIGVSPPGFIGANVGSIADITLAVGALPVLTPPAAPLLGPGNFWLRILARPQVGVSASEAETRLRALWPAIADTVISPAWPAPRRAAMAKAVWEAAPGDTGWSYLRPIFRKPLLVLMAVVALVLAIACANVASLLLARAAFRRREIAIRLAIGAGRGRVVRQLLTESLLLSACGGSLGIGLAWWSGQALLRILSTGPQNVAIDLTPNWHVLLFTSAVAIGTGLLFGIGPAFYTTAVEPFPEMKEDHRTGRSRLLSSLVSVQVALSLLLLVGAGLFLRTLQNLESLDPGFRREGVLLVSLDGRRTAFPKQQLDELLTIPGVVAVSLSTHTPLSGATWTDPAGPAGQPLPDRDNAFFIAAAPAFFRTLGTPLLAGRDFTGRDSLGAPYVAIVNQAYASRYFPGANPVGQHLTSMVRGRPTDLEIVGIAKDVDLAGLRRQPPAAVYVPYYQLPAPDPSRKYDPGFPTTLEIRAAGGLPRVAEEIRRRLQPHMANEALEIRPLTAQVEATFVQERLIALLGTMFGVLAMVLAFVGLYGLLAYDVARRTREMGIRIALGARQGSVIAMVLKRAAILVAAGIAVGLPAAFAASHWVQSMLFGLKPGDPVTTTAAVLLLVAEGILAALLPARRAVAIDPMRALRHE